MSGDTDETRADCVFSAERIDLLEGNLDPERIDAFGSHLESCSLCSVELARLTTDDPLVALLRNQSDSAVTEKEVQRSIALVETVGHESSKTAKLVLRQLGQYELLELLGKGGMGAVYRARHKLMDRIVALKTIRSNQLADDKTLERFQREILALARLDHPNIIRAEYADEADGTYFLVTDYVSGKNLDECVKRKYPFSFAEVCRIARDVGSALQHIHEFGLVHRDIKPSNILWTEQGEAKLLDLGLALFREEELGEGELTGSGAILGTYHFMAPEQWDASHNVDIRADLYGLGCTLYFLIAQTPPFASVAGNSPTRLMRAHASSVAPSLRSVSDDVPQGFADVVNRLMEKEPNARYQTPAELLSALQPFLDVNAHPRCPTKKRNVGGWAAAALVLLVGGVALLGRWLLRDNTPRSPEPAPNPVVRKSPPKPVEPPRLAVANLRVGHYRGDPPVELGTLGQTSSGMSVDDDLKLELEFAVRAYCYIIAFGADGSSELCYPTSPDDYPEPTIQLTYPANPREYFYLGEGPGLHAFAIVASRKPLPTYRLWSKSEIPRWRPLSHNLAWGVWEHDGTRVRLIDEPKVRGVRLLGLLPSVVRCLMADSSLGLAGVPWEACVSSMQDGPAYRLEELARSLQNRPHVEALHVVGFAVRPK